MDVGFGKTLYELLEADQDSNVFFDRYGSSAVFTEDCIDLNASTPKPHSEELDIFIPYVSELVLGTSVAVFPNSTFSNLAIVQGNDEYTAWMRRALDNANTPRGTYLGWGWGANMCPINEVDIHQLPKTPWPLSYLQKILLPSFKPKTETKTGAAIGQFVTFNDTSPLLDLIAELKRKTESRLGHALARVTVSYPSFFYEGLIKHLEHVLKELSLQDDGCHGDARSSVAAMVAYRQAESDLEHSTRPLDCVHGRFGLENVVHIENTEQFLVITAFEFYAGNNSSWTRRSFRQPTFLKKNCDPTRPSSTENAIGKEANMSSTPLQKDFWATAQVCFENYFAAQYTSQSKTVYRLVLTGSQSYDLNLLQALRNTRGVEALIPSSSPTAIQVHRDDAEISQKVVEHRTGLLCLLDEYSMDWGLWHKYGQDLLDSRCQETCNFATSIDPIFAAARGAALYSLESRLVPCVGECNMTLCPERRPWQGENDFVLERNRKEDSVEVTA